MRTQMVLLINTNKSYKIKKPIRLIELFAGIGSQAKALKNINANFEIYKVVEFDSYVIKSYNSIHNTNFEATDITKITANDLNIVNTNEYEYIMTYSFPCQDLSLTGKRKGMKKGDSTRSGLLWEVERILLECKDKELPQLLLMENVPQVIGSSNYKYFMIWTSFLSKLGYTNHYKLLNAKDYGIPQNRNRCFMVSILGDYSYSFPQPIKLDKRLKDLLEDNVDEKYYLSDKMIEGVKNTNFDSYKLENKLLDKNGIASTIIARFEGAPQCIKDTNTTLARTQGDNNLIAIKNATKQGYIMAEDGDGVDISGRMEYHRGTVQKGMAQTIKTSNDVGVVVSIKEDKKYFNLKKYGSYYTWKNKQGKYNTQCNRAVSPEKCALTIACTEPGKVINNLRIRKLTPKECWRLMGFSDEDFEKASKVNSNSQLYKQAGNSIVVNVLEAIFKQFLEE